MTHYSLEVHSAVQVELKKSKFECCMYLKTNSISRECLLEYKRLMETTLNVQVVWEAYKARIFSPIGLNAV